MAIVVGNFLLKSKQCRLLSCCLCWSIWSVHICHGQMKIQSFLVTTWRKVPLESMGFSVLWCFKPHRCLHRCEILVTITEISHVDCVCLVFFHHLKSHQSILFTRPVIIHAMCEILNNPELSVDLYMYEGFCFIGMYAEILFCMMKDHRLSGCVKYSHLPAVNARFPLSRLSDQSPYFSGTPLKNSHLIWIQHCYGVHHAYKIWTSSFLHFFSTGTEHLATSPIKVMSA